MGVVVYGILLYFHDIKKKTHINLILKSLITFSG